MKIITLWQPWASLVAYGFKQDETRSWSTNYRGQLLIHAAKRPFVSPDGSEILDGEAYYVWLRALELAYESGLINDQSKLPFAHQLPLGCVVAAPEVTDCKMMNLAEEGEEKDPFFEWIDDQTELEIAVGDWRVGRYAWKLENVQRLEREIPWKGGQGLRNAPSELAAMIEGQLSSQLVELGK